MIKFERYINLDNGFVADLGEEKVIELKENIPWYVFIISDLTKSCDSADIQIIPAELVFTCFYEIAMQLPKRFLILKEIRL